VTVEIPVTRAEYDAAMELARDGASNATIGLRLYKTEQTIKSQMKLLLQRTGADSRTHLAVLLAREEIVLVPVPIVGTPR